VSDDAARPDPLAPRLGIALAVAVAAALVFLPALGGQFLGWDDNTTLTGNTGYRGLGGGQLGWMFTTTLMGHYVPLTWLSFAVTYVVFGMNPWGYHLGSLLLHALNAGLVAWLAWRLIGAGLAREGAAGPAGAERVAIAVGAAVAGLAFGVHPLRAESVAWATDRGDVLCATFYLAALVAYVRGVDGGGGLRWRPWGTLALLAMSAALLSKEIAVTLPAVLLILDAYPLRRPLSWGGRVWEKLPFLALALLGAAVAVAARATGARFSTIEQYGIGARLAMAAYSVWYFVATSVWPAGLAPYHEPPMRVDLLVPRFLMAAIAVLALTVAVVLLRRRWPAGLATWAAYALVLLPVSGLAHSGSHLVAERYGYLPGAALALLLGGIAAAAVRGGRVAPGRRVAVAALLLVLGLALAGWAAVAWRHSASWHDNFTFWRVSAAADPECRLCVLNLSAEYFNTGRFVEAEAWARRAMPLWPGRGTPHHRLGAALLAQNRDAEAEAELREAIRLAPRLAEAHRELGRLYARQGRTAEAATALREALVLGVSPAEIEALLRPLEAAPPPARRSP
jgi:tetratricopeptide (TPR) repeat protein